MRHRSKKKGTKTKASSPKPIREKTQKGQPQGRHAKHNETQHALDAMSPQKRRRGLNLLSRQTKTSEIIPPSRLCSRRRNGSQTLLSLFPTSNQIICQIRPKSRIIIAIHKLPELIICKLQTLNNHIIILEFIQKNMPKKVLIP